MLAGDDFPDLVELIHQVALGVQTSGGIDKQNIVLIPDGDIHRLPRHGGGIGVLPLGVETGTRAFRPNAELFHGGSPEGVGGGKEDFFALHTGAVGQFGDGRGLAYAVDADDQNDLRRVDRDDAARDAENVFQLRGEERTKFLGSGRGSGTRTGLEAFAQLGRGFDAHVRHNEEFFQFVPEVGGQVAVAGEEGGEPFAELFTGPFQPLMQLEENAVAFILFVLKIESKGEAVLQFRTEVRHFFVFHARGPCGEVGDEGIGFVLRGSKGGQKEADTLPEFVARACVGSEIFQSDGQPHGQARFGFPEGKQQRIAPSGRFLRGVGLRGRLGGSRRCGSLPVRFKRLSGSELIHFQIGLLLLCGCRFRQFFHNLHRRLWRVGNGRFFVRCTVFRFRWLRSGQCFLRRSLWRFRSFSSFIR